MSSQFALLCRSCGRRGSEKQHNMPPAGGGLIILPKKSWNVSCMIMFLLASMPVVANDHMNAKNNNTPHTMMTRHFRRARSCGQRAAQSAHTSLYVLWTHSPLTLTHLPSFINCAVRQYCCVRAIAFVVESHLESCHHALSYANVSHTQQQFGRVVTHVNILCLHKLNST